MTHTCAAMPVPETIHRWIKAYLLEVGYEHAVHESSLDMHGIALTVSDSDPFARSRDLLVRVRALLYAHIAIHSMSNGPAAIDVFSQEAKALLVEINEALGV